MYKLAWSSPKMVFNQSFLIWFLSSFNENFSCGWLGGWVGSRLIHWGSSYYLEILIPQLDMGAVCSQGMGKGEASSPPRQTFFDIFQKNRHAMAFPFLTNDALKVSVSRKYHILICFCNRVLFRDTFWVRTDFGQKFWRQAILFPLLLLKNSPFRKNIVYHDKASGKCCKIEITRNFGDAF